MSLSLLSQYINMIWPASFGAKTLGCLLFVGVGGITYILGDIFRSCRALFFIKTYIKRNKMLKELVHLMHFWRFAAQKCKNLLFCLRCNVNKNKNRSFWSILTFSWIKNNFQQLLFLHFFPFKASLRILIMYIYIYIWGIKILSKGLNEKKFKNKSCWKLFFIQENVNMDQKDYFCFY